MSPRARFALASLLVGCAPAREEAAARGEESPAVVRDDPTTLAAPLVGGAPDPSFDASGVALDLLPMSLAVTPSGGVLVGGGRTLVRLDESGALDPSFGDGGVLVDPTMSAADVTIQPDGKILVAGIEPNAAEGSRGLVLAIVRLLPDGSHDPSFGDAGKVVIGPERLSTPDGVSRIVVRPDGRIVAAASFYPAPAVVSLGRDGRLDALSETSSFGGLTMDGEARVAIADRDAIARYDRDTVFFLRNRAARTYALPTAAPDGAIVAACADASTKGLCRWTNDATPDAAFGEAGRVAFGWSVKGLALDSAARPVALAHNGLTYALARFDARGANDAAFGRDGFVPYDGTPRRVVVTADDRIVVAGVEAGTKSRLRVTRHLP